MQPEIEHVQLATSAPQEAVLLSTSDKTLFLAGIGCFVADTPVLTATGHLPIAQITPGTLVASVNQSSGEVEYKPVLQVFAYGRDKVSQDMITFVLKSGEQITCTQNHEFYDGATYVPATELARRAMASSTQDNPVLCFDRRPALNPSLAQAHRATGRAGNEARRRYVRLYANNDSTGWDYQNGKDSPANSGGVFTQPASLIRCKPPKRHQIGQPTRKFAVGNPQPERETRLCNGANVECWGEAPAQQSNGRNSHGDTGAIRAVCMYAEDASGRVRAIKSHDSRRDIVQNLAAPAIAQLITSAQPALVYDLCVADNHNYTVGLGCYHVHNSGKSHNIALSSADFAINHPNIIQFVGANTYKQLTLSTLKRVFDTWLSVFDWKKGRDFVVGTIPPGHWPMYGAALKSYDSVITFENGHQIVTGSLDNYKALDGQEFGVAHLDETKDTKEEAVSEVILTRLRQPGLWLDDDGQLYGTPEHDALLAAGDWQYSTTADGERLLTAADGRNVRSWNPLFIYTSPAKVDWINLMFNLTSEYEEISRRIFSKTDFYHKATKEQCVVISSTYHNQDNLPVGFIQKKERDYAGNPSRRDMLIYGSPIAKSGGEFLPQFERLRHVKKALEPVAGYAAHVTLDFNVVPYMTMLAAQLIEAPNDRLTLRFFAEYALESPNNNTAAICRAFVADYGAQLDNGLFFYGDPAGRARQTVTTEFKNNYSVVAKEFAPYIGNYSDRVQNVAPGIIDRRDFLGALFDGTLGIDIEIDDRLTHFIHDLEYCKEDANGKMLKPKYKNPQTGQTYERYGHHLDAATYLICSLLKQQYDTFRQRR